LDLSGVGFGAGEETIISGDGIGVGNMDLFIAVIVAKFAVRRNEANMVSH